jgi:RNA polymerase sigma-70 factor (ECF subfamily)
LTTLPQLKEIIDGLLQDSPKAMKHVYDLFYQPLCFFAMRYAQNMTFAEEIVSDVMYKIWQNRHIGYRPETFKEYLFSATRNTALNYLKQQNNQKEILDSWSDELRTELIEETPLDILISKETQANINSLIDTLPEQCRKIFLMSRMEEMTYEEIAAQMNISTNTVKYHIKTALQRLNAGIGNLFVWLILFSSFFVIFLLHIPTLNPFSIVFIVSSLIP